MAIGVWGGLPHTEEAAGSKAGGTRARGEMPRHLIFIFHPKVPCFLPFDVPVDSRDELLEQEGRYRLCKPISVPAASVRKWN